MYQRRLHRGEEFVCSLFGARNLADGAIEQPGVVEIHRLQGADGARGNIQRIHRDAQSSAGENSEFSPRVEAVNIFGRISFRKTELLRFLQRVCKRNSGAFNSRQDVIAGAVENAAELDQFVARETFLQAGDHRDTSRNRRAECNVCAVLASEADEFGAVARNELLVGGDDRLSGLQCAAYPIASGIEATDQFDDDVSVGRENALKLFRPEDARLDPIHLLALHSAIADLSEAQTGRRVLGENASDGAADGAEAEDGDVQGLLRGIHRFNPVRTAAFLPARTDLAPLLSREDFFFAAPFFL